MNGMNWKRKRNNFPTDERDSVEFLLCMKEFYCDSFSFVQVRFLLSHAELDFILSSEAFTFCNFFVLFGHCILGLY